MTTHGHCKSKETGAREFLARCLAGDSDPAHRLKTRCKRKKKARVK